MGSDELYTEINHVLGKFSQPFLVLLQHTDAAIQAQAQDKKALTNTCNTMVLILKLFYDLSCQDLPPAFEENLSGILSLLHKYVSYDNPLLHTDDESESGVLEFMKAGIFEALTLYVRKYDDAFGPLVQEHVNSCWNFLTSVGSEQKYDILVSKALQFLTAVAFIPGHAGIFGSEEIITQLIQRVVLPNLTLRESDLELFEDEPIEYIRRDLEGSDSDTRRRAATDLVRQLVAHHEEMVTKVVSNQISLHLQEYAKNPQENWKFKDTAVYLFCSIAAKGVATSGHGVTSTNPHVDIFDFFRQHIAGDLTDASAQPVLQVDAIKFLYVFRSLLSQEHWNQAFPLLVQRLNSPQYVIYTYAAIVVERALALSSDAKEPVIPRDEVVKLSKDLLEHLFGIIQKNSEPEKVQENEFLMRCVMRVLIVIREGVLHIVDMVLQNLINITMVIRQNPSNPRFYYYHFEAVGALVRFAAPSNPEKMENALYEAFVYILQNNVEEFAPYVFQLFAALLETNPTGKLSEYYVDLIPPVLQPVVWESKGNVPGLVRLLTAIIPRGVDTMTKNNQIEPLLGVFQKLVSAKFSEVHGFDLLESVLANFPAAALQAYFAPMFQIMMTRLTQSKTEQFTQRFVRFYHFFAARDKEGLGVDAFVTVCDQVQLE
jgi:exportin-2 (importin alpha re-exporter)